MGKFFQISSQLVEINSIASTKSIVLVNTYYLIFLPLFLDYSSSSSTIHQIAKDDYPVLNKIGLIFRLHMIRQVMRRKSTNNILGYQ